MRAAVLALVLVACGGSRPESTLATHEARRPNEDPAPAIPGLGEIRWIEAGSAVRDVSVSPGRIAAVLDDGSLVTFDLATGARSTARPADAAAPPTFPSLSPDGTLVAHCVGPELSIIDIAHGTYGIFDHEADCAGPALWSPDGARVYAVLVGNVLHAFDVSTATALGRGDGLGGAVFVTRDGEIVADGEHRVVRLDASLSPIASYTMPELSAQHGSEGQSFVLAAIDRTTYVYAAGASNYDVVLVHEGAIEDVLWSSAQNERWDAVFPLPDERAFLLVQRPDGTALARVVNVRTGQAVAEMADVAHPADVAADGSVAAAGIGGRIAVLGIH